MIDFYLVMCFFLFYFQSLKKPFYLLKSDLFYFIRCPGPLKLHIIQKFFGCKHKSIIIISQNFYGILPPVAKDKYIAAVIRIQFKIKRDCCNQPRDLLSKICKTTGEEYTGRSFSKPLHHNFFNVCKSFRSVPGLKSSGTYIFIP